MTLGQKLFVMSQHIIPQHLLTKIAGKLAASESKWLKELFINQFIKKFDISLEEAQIKDVSQFTSFNDFFTRALVEGARPTHPHPQSLVSPADGAISQAGTIAQDRVFQAKGHHFSLPALLGKKPDPRFLNGRFATIYLSPKDYHRVHMPCDATLSSMDYIPGDLFSVNGATAQGVNNLFARNERLVCHFDTAFGPMVMVLVGAMIVASIETPWEGLINGNHSEISRFDYRQDPIELKKGDEMGRFLLGSTVVMILPKGKVGWMEGLEEGKAVKVGSPIGKHALS